MNLRFNDDSQILKLQVPNQLNQGLIDFNRIPRGAFFAEQSTVLDGKKFDVSGTVTCTAHLLKFWLVARQMRQLDKVSQPE